MKNKNLQNDFLIKDEQRKPNRLIPETRKQASKLEKRRKICSKKTRFQSFPRRSSD